MMNTKDLIEAAKFQVSVKPQDEFMREVAEGLEKLNRRYKRLLDVNAMLDKENQELRKQNVQCIDCRRGVQSTKRYIDEGIVWCTNHNKMFYETFSCSEGISRSD